MSRARVRWLLLNQGRDSWRFSIAEDPEALACGRLTELPPDAPFEAARDALAQLVRVNYGIEVAEAAWKATEDGFGADLTQP